MRERTPLLLAASVLVATVTVAWPAPANAQQDTCPAGSLWKTKDGEGWCEPTICDSDAQCPTGEVCRPLSLCVEIGKLDPKNPDAGAALMARQKCGENKSCPQNTTCSEKSRCMSKATADKLGLLSTSPPSAASRDDAPKKRSCGCDVPGGKTSGGAFFLVLALASVTALRRRARY
jgi:MYXO-CTERM domain-containing protein